MGPGRFNRFLSERHSKIDCTTGGCGRAYTSWPATMTQEEGKAYFSQKKYKEVRSLHIDIPMKRLSRKSSAKLSRKCALCLFWLQNWLIDEARNTPWHPQTCFIIPKYVSLHIIMPSTVGSSKTPPGPPLVCCRFEPFEAGRGSWPWWMPSLGSSVNQCKPYAAYDTQLVDVYWLIGGLEHVFPIYWG